MSIDLRKFVDINIKQRTLSTVKTTRDVVVLFTDAVVEDAVYSDIDSVQNALSTFPTIINAAKTFFECGGKKIRIVPNVNYTKDAILAAVKDLPDEQIVVTYAKSAAANDIAQRLAEVASAYNVDYYGIKTKLFIAPVSALTSTIGLFNAKNIANLILKYDKSSNFTNRADLSIAAYLSKIDVLKEASINDYCYTVEPTRLRLELTDDDIDNSRDTNINVDIFLAGLTRNIGGNCSNGDDIVNTYVRIILQQSVTDSLINLLSQHIKNSAGLTQIYSTIAKDLQKYLTCGYLVTDKVWADETMSIEYNNKNYTIVKTGTPFSNGYILTILPYDSLTDEDKRQRKTPPIYLLLAEQYGIRTITINGEVI